MTAITSVPSDQHARVSSASLVCGQRCFPSPAIGHRSHDRAALYTDPDTIPSAALIPGAVTLQPAAVSVPDAIFAPSSGASAALLPNLVADSDTIPAPAAATGAFILSAPSIAADNSFALASAVPGPSRCSRRKWSIRMRSMPSRSRLSLSCSSRSRSMMPMSSRSLRFSRVKSCVQHGGGISIASRSRRWPAVFRLPSRSSA